MTIRMNLVARRFYFSYTIPSRLYVWAAIQAVLLFSTHLMAAQTTLLSDIPLDSSTFYAIKVYTETIGASSRLYTGTQYKAYEIQSYDTGHPYFISDEWETGSVHYDGLFFTNVSIWLPSQNPAF
ncbi:MAG: hypothetical protein OEV74_21070 [Cyclobacteriaceae bacterium]|nr:hypothetical protein [Cyclobacteriaceae bacterium]MDH4298777.1 hypothetical protein [Cyclobacteriaceae bacterium]MDH5250808.1 hypothetical protein [Cyclobacteriaceae bacterium]